MMTEARSPGLIGQHSWCLSHVDWTGSTSRYLAEVLFPVLDSFCLVILYSFFAAGRMPGTILTS